MIDLSHEPFFLFGMGPWRRKLLYKGGTLSNALSGQVLCRWDAASEKIVPDRCLVRLTTRDGLAVALREDRQGVWVETPGNRLRAAEDGEDAADFAHGLPPADRNVRLPSFEGHPHASLLRTLHQEVLVNIAAHGPVPNLLVYPRPWYRDAAVMCMVLARTDNLHLVRDWIMALRQPYDRNNAGHCESDNLGQVLYMISLVSDASHPLVATVLDEARRTTVKNHLTGLTDFNEHPAYQTRWLKLGLRSLGLPDPYVVPDVADSYAQLFWMDRGSDESFPPPSSTDATTLAPALAGDYPYLAWAKAHSRRTGAAPGSKLPLDLLAEGYPLTWEANASQADYRGMERACRALAARKTCMPHTWHAAEAFLAILDAR